MQAPSIEKFVFELPLWYVASRAQGITEVATGRVGGNPCLLLFTTAEFARQCLRHNRVTGAKIGRLANPQEVYDFLLQRLPADVTHVAFDVSQVGDVTPAIVTWEDLARTMRKLVKQPAKV